MQRYTYQVILLGLVVLLGATCRSETKKQSHADREETAVALQNALEEHSVNPWYPQVIDSVEGGYLSDLNFQWVPDGAQDKMIVSQARHVWVCSKLAAFIPDGKSYESYARHGFDFMARHMWDSLNGGFFNLVDRGGELRVEGDSVLKTAYGNAFAIYGLSAFYGVSRHQQALDLAIRTFRWLDQHSHDSVYGGYNQFLLAEGTPLTAGFQGTPPKDQNSSIHLLEAFTELYEVWPNDTLEARLQELLVIIRDTITTPKGTMNLFFQRDWTPFSYKDSIESGYEQHFSLDHVSFGHDIETAYLLMEAAEVLGWEHDSLTLAKAKLMVDHTLDNGWDNTIGGIYDGGYYFNEDSLDIIKDTKVWWAQAEALNSLLIMAELHPHDPQEYHHKFEQQWQYIQDYMLDREHKGWYWGGLDKEPDRRTSAKGQIWKVNYHTVRSLMNCIKTLEGNQ